MSKHKLAQTFKSKFKSKHIFVIQTTSLNRGCQTSINEIDAYKETFFKMLQLWQEEKSFKKQNLPFIILRVMMRVRLSLKRSQGTHNYKLDTQFKWHLLN